MYSVESWRETYSVGEKLEGNVFRRRELEGNVLRKERECVFEKDVLRRESWRETYSVGESRRKMYSEKTERMYSVERERESFEENVTPSTAANRS
jgi:hypothetical protein